MLIDLIKISLITFIFYALGEPGMIFDWYQKLIGRLPELLWKPLGGCLRCFSGQVGFWFYLIVYFKEYNFFDHLFFVSATIFLSMVYHGIYSISAYIIKKYGTT